MIPKPYPTPERIREVLSHDPKEDVFRWLERKRGRPTHGIAGDKCFFITIDGVAIKKKTLAAILWPTRQNSKPKITPEAFDQLVQVKKPRTGRPVSIAGLKPYPTPERVREVVSHDDETDTFRWKVTRSRHSRKGAIACPGVATKIDGHIVTRVKLKALYEQVIKRPKPKLKQSPSAIADELRKLRMTEPQIADYVRRLIVARKLRKQPRMNHNQTEEHEHGRT